MSFRDYWDDLVELSAGNLAEEDNERTALVMYRELAGQIVSRAEEFQDSGVEKEEKLEALARMEAHLEEDFQDISADLKEKIHGETAGLEEEIRQARRGGLLRVPQEENGKEEKDE